MKQFIKEIFFIKKNYIWDYALHIRLTHTKYPKEILNKIAEMLDTWSHHSKKYNLVTAPFNMAVPITTQVQGLILKTSI